jgi:tRNA pseudouridine13 synthase
LKPVPEIDRMAGMQCYCTEFAGTGGSIKQSSGEFRVSEIVDDSLLAGVSPSFSDSHRYPLYLLEKEGMDSNHALMEIERVHRLKLRVLGIKDAKAATRQYAGASHTWKDPPKKLETLHTSLLLQGFTKKPIGRESLAGNEFEISIHGAAGKADGFAREVDKIANFYGLQRFGSERLVTHLVGKEIVKKNFVQAVKLLLCHTTKYDTESSREIRKRCEDPANYRRALKETPRGMDIERMLLSALVDGKEPVAALRAVPITIRRLFVQAYQAFLFNKCLSRAVLARENIGAAKEGDLCFEMEGPFVFGRIIKFSQSGKKMVPAVRMAGYTFQPGKGRFETITKELLEQEGVVAKDFYIKEMQELSQQGGFRQAPLWCRDFAIASNPLRVSFKLPKGSYATTLLRELMKPDEPTGAGF